MVLMLKFTLLIIFLMKFGRECTLGIETRLSNLDKTTSDSVYLKLIPTKMRRLLLLVLSLKSVPIMMTSALLWGAGTNNHNYGRVDRVEDD